MQKKSLIDPKNFEFYQRLQKDSPIWYSTDSLQDPFSKALVISTNPPKVKIKNIATNETLEVLLETIYERSSNDQLYDDMVNIDCLNEAELLCNLRARFIEGDEIFTYVGPTLLIINPYRLLPEVFSIKNLALYQKEVNNITFTVKDFKPHIYAISADVFKKLFENQQNQAMVISGESGAGKTENVKYAMQFLTSLGNVSESRNIAKDMFRKSSSINKRFSLKKEAIEEKILSCNPILEAFGNAKTVRNDNSSRFGKYVSLMVDKGSRKILGARLINYLLEKSRIVQQSKDERNYHIFYHVLQGADQDSLINLGLDQGGAKAFKYLNQSGCVKVEKMDDGMLFHEVETAMMVTGFGKFEIKTIWKLIAAILHLGNLDFEDKNLSDTNPCNISSFEAISYFEELLSVDRSSLMKCLLYKTREINKQIIESPLNAKDCQSIRDSINKDLYDRLFTWLVRKLNLTISPLPGCAQETYAIGLLDIFGFECFKVNSFEQLCINYTNEKLQQLYIAYVFKAEKEEFIKEGLDKFICELKFQDNQPIIELMEQAPLGIFNLLDESCSIAADDEKLLNKIRTSHKTNPYFQIPKTNKDGFIILHSAKDVEYQIPGFREKNKDEVPKIVNLVFEGSQDKYFRSIYKNVEYEEEMMEKAGSQSYVAKTLNAKFRSQMKALMIELRSCECHFIRCIKPNEEKKPGVWNGNLVLQQIRYLGVLESIKVRKESFPVRRPYKLFYQKYEELRNFSAPSFLELEQKNVDFTDLTKKLLEGVLKKHPEELVLYGKNKLFLRNKTFLLIEKMYSDKMRIKNEQAYRVQRAFYRYKQMKKLRQMFKALKKIKTLWKVRMEYNHFQKMRRAARKVQAFYKNRKNGRDIVKKRINCVIIQKYLRRFLAFRKFGKMNLKEKIRVIVRNLMRWVLKRKNDRNKEISEIVLREVFERAWASLLEKKVKVLQKNARKYIAIVNNYDIVKKSRQAKKKFRENKAAINIQKNYKSVIARNTFNKQKHSINKIKGFFAMRILNKQYVDMRKSAVFIQKVMKPILQKKLFNNKINVEYIIEQEKKMKEQQNSLNKLFSRNENSVNEEKYENEGNNENLSKSIEKTLKSKKFLSPTKGKVKEQISPIRNITPYTPKNISFFILLLDVDFMVDLSEEYKDSPWVDTFLHFSQENLKNETDIQYLSIGDTHSSCISGSGMIYTWGSNDFMQLGQNSSASISILNSTKEFKPKLMASGDTSNILVDCLNKVYVWGNPILNEKNENSQNFSSFNLSFPTEVFQCDDSDSAVFEPVKDVKIKGKTHYLTTENGKLYVWPQKIKGEINSTPLKIQPLAFPTNLIVSQIACSYHFLIILSKSGLLYSLGSDNQEGELGHGDKTPRKIPCLIEALTNEKIDGVECGYRHVICKSTLGKVYTWGWGIKGQLGQNSNTSEPSPKIIPLTIGYKAIQIMTGFASSIILMDDKRIYWFGKIGGSKEIWSPIEVHLEQKFNDLTADILPVRVIGQWNKTSSVIFATFADLRTTNLINKDMQNKVLNNLITKWQNDSIYSVFPPFVETISKYFSPKVMKLETKMKSKETPKKEKRKKERKNSSLERREKVEEHDYNKKLQNPWSEIKVEQLKKMKERIEKLKTLPKDKWNERDVEFMELMKNSKISSFLDSAS